MASSALSALTAASALDGTELLYAVQGGADRKATAAQLKTYVAGALGAATATSVLSAGGSLTVGAPSGFALILRGNGGDSWQVGAAGAGHLIAVADGLASIGLAGSNRPKALYLAPSTTSAPNINLPATGVAPSSPTNGDIWFDGTNLNIRIGGATKTVNVT